jgi:hypothetical protein
MISVKNILLIHAFIEMIGGMVLVFRPDLLLMLGDQQLETIVVAKLYGILALTFGGVSFMFYRMFQYNDTCKKVTLMIMFFHLMISFQMYAAFTQETVSSLGAFGLHLILAILFFGAYMIDINKFSSEQTR